MNIQRTAVIFVFHQINPQATLFFENGIFKSDTVDFFLVKQGKFNLPFFAKIFPSNVKIVETENRGSHFAGWSDVLFNSINRSLYDSFIFVNDSCKGPFLPSYLDKTKWVEYLTKKLNADVKLFGATIARYNSFWYVQAYCLVMDQKGLKVAIDSEVFTRDIINDTNDMFTHLEVKLSQEILKAGFNIGCCLSLYDGIDFRKPIETSLNLDHTQDKGYFGSLPNPFETIFVKLNYGQSIQPLEPYSMSLHNNKKHLESLPKTLPIDFSPSDYVELNPDLACIKGQDAKLIEHFLNHGNGSKENRRYSKTMGAVGGKMVKGPIQTEEDKFFKFIINEFPNKKCLEIGGPSNVTFINLSPVYKSITHLDIVCFAKDTVWAKMDKTLDFYGGKIAKFFIEEGSLLSSVKNESYDILLASHSLEHIANPLKALENWKRVVKPGGIILLVLPKKEFTFDHKRNITKFATILDKYKRNVGEDDLSSLTEILQLHDLSKDLAAGNFAQFKSRSERNFQNRCLHHHVFDYELLLQMAVHFNLSWIDHHTLGDLNQFVILKK